MIGAIAKLVRCESLSEAEASSAFETIMIETPRRVLPF